MTIPVSHKLCEGCGCWKRHYVAMACAFDHQQATRPKRGPDSGMSAFWLGVAFAEGRRAREEFQIDTQNLLPGTDFMKYGYAGYNPHLRTVEREIKHLKELLNVVAASRGDPCKAVQA